MGVQAGTVNKGVQLSEVTGPLECRVQGDQTVSLTSKRPELLRICISLSVNLLELKSKDVAFTSHFRGKYISLVSPNSSHFLKNGFLEMYFPYMISIVQFTLHSLKIYNPMMFSILTELFNYHPKPLAFSPISLPWQPPIYFPFLWFTFHLYGLAFAYLGVFTYKQKHTVCGLLCWLLSLSIMFPRFIHVGACLHSPFLFTAEQHSIVQRDHFFLTFIFICKFIKGKDCLHFCISSIQHHGLSSAFQ